MFLCYFIIHMIKTFLIAYFIIMTVVPAEALAPQSSAAELGRLYGQHTDGGAIFVNKDAENIDQFFNNKLKINPGDNGSWTFEALMNQFNSEIDAWKRSTGVNASSLKIENMA